MIVDNDETLINCLAYIVLNPVRAGIRSKPDQQKPGKWRGIRFYKSKYMDIPSEKRYSLAAIHFAS